MKRKINRFNYMLIAFIGLTLGACSDYFDVRPKSQVLAEEMFENEQGFNDQLIGVYKRMASSSLYAQEMTFGLMEVLSQNYDLPVGSPYEEAAKYNYASAGIKAKVDAIWSEMYTGIANLNIMLSYIDAKQSVFTGENYRLYKGEALGLRAFLHFDLLRMFAPAYSVNPAAPAIPYVREYTTEVTPQSTVAQVIEAAITDLKEALVLLESDPLFITDSYNAYYEHNRTYRFNYYAVAATLARVYQWRGTPSDMAEALKYARIVIEDEKFSWVHYTAITTSNRNERDVLFTNELVFRLNLPDMDEAIKPYFHEGAPTDKLSPTSTKWDAIYEMDKGYGQDYRHTYHFDYEGSEQYLTKYWQPEAGRYLNYMPVIRWSEMYYIAAEACADNEPAQAIEYLNTVRDYRNLSDFALEGTLSADKIREEIYKEYRKELMGEGQLFYYYKRLNYANIPGSSVAAGEQVYKIPMPDNEVEFGGRK